MKYGNRFITAILCVGGISNATAAELEEKDLWAGMQDVQQRVTEASERHGLGQFGFTDKAGVVVRHRTETEASGLMLGLITSVPTNISSIGRIEQLSGGQIKLEARAQQKITSILSRHSDWLESRRKERCQIARDASVSHTDFISSGVQEFEATAERKSLVYGEIRAAVPTAVGVGLDEYRDTFLEKQKSTSVAKTTDLFMEIADVVRLAAIQTCNKAEKLVANNLSLIHI